MEELGVLGREKGGETVFNTLFTCYSTKSPFLFGVLTVLFHVASNSALVFPNALYLRCIFRLLVSQRQDGGYLF